MKALIAAMNEDVVDFYRLSAPEVGSETDI